jgi:hypothetical protein
MPKALIKKIAASERARGVDPKKAESIAYGAANNRGWMKGSKETAKGATAEAKFVKDHGAGKRRR